MVVKERVFNASPQAVWDVLTDGWLYPLWVVGATRMRDVDATWPQQGAKIHHSAGVWPAVLDDNTEVLESDPGRFLRLRARGWPIGEAEVSITLTPSGAHTVVEIAEKAVSGPGALIPAPVEAVMMKWRNSETLRRLAYVAENRQTS